MGIETASLANPVKSQFYEHFRWDRSKEGQVQNEGMCIKKEEGDRGKDTWREILNTFLFKEWSLDQAMVLSGGLVERQTHGLGV